MINIKVDFKQDYYNYIFHEVELLREAGFSFPKIRNEIIHTGKVPKSIPLKKCNREINMSVEFARTLFLLDKIILSLLKYNGKFNDYLNKKEISFKH